jgi:hypothetical protein
MHRGTLESGASANFGVLPDRQRATGKGRLAQLLDAQSHWCREEKQLLCSVEEIILKARGRGYQMMILNLGACLERRQQIRFGIRARSHWFAKSPSEKVLLQGPERFSHC